jgi:pyruvate kinase
VRRTRIVATIGPASESDEILKALAVAGVDVFRLSFAHGDIPSGIERLRRVRALVPDRAIMVDIPGPKIRAGSFGTTPVVLSVGDEIELSEGFDQTSTAKSIVVERLHVLAQLAVGDKIHIGDGGVSLLVEQTGSKARARVTSGGTVMGKPGLSLPSSLLNDRLPTDDDRDRLEALHTESFEILAVSFVRSAFDMVSVRSALGRDDVMLMAKIETGEGVENLDEIITVSDAIMVARGDLGVRMPIEEVPHLQKEIVRHGVRYARPVVVATQMLESMTHSQVPTRAEVTDVANAVLDGASAVMLSGETAIGDDPVATVTTMDRIVRRAEEYFDYTGWGADLGVQQIGTGTRSTRVTAAITGAAWRADRRVHPIRYDRSRDLALSTPHADRRHHAERGHGPTAPLFVGRARDLRLAGPGHRRTVRRRGHATEAIGHRQIRRPRRDHGRFDVGRRAGHRHRAHAHRSVATAPFSTLLKKMSFETSGSNRGGE